MSAKSISDLSNLNEIRSSHNKELIRRMRNGDSLTSFDSQSSWFPPREIIEKDQNEMDRLYGSKADKTKPVATESKTSTNVLKLIKAD